MLTREGVLSVTNSSLAEDNGNEVNAAGMKERQLAAAREKLDICGRNVPNHVESIVYHSDAGQSLVIHYLQSIG
jgi:hypothetical protein